MSKIIFMGTPAFSVACLKALLQKHEIQAIFCQPDRPVGRKLHVQPPPVKSEGLLHQIPIFQPNTLHTLENIDLIRNLKPDFIVIVAYGKILKQSLLNLPRYGCINVHASLLPKYRGASPIQAAILNNEPFTGVTTMQLAPTLDAGDWYLQESIPIHASDTAGTLHERLAPLGAKVLLKTLEGIESGTLVAKPQDHSQATFCQKIEKQDQWLTGELSALECLQKIKAFDPWPGTSIQIANKRLIVKSAIAHPYLSKPVSVLSADNEKLFFGTTSGALELLIVQLEGKKPINAQQFLSSYPEWMNKR